MKAWKIAFRSSAKNDIQEAVDYYDGVSSHAGDQFLKQLESAIHALGINPYFQVRYDNIRCIPLRKFPFMIHYQIDESKSIVIVFAILHTSKSSGKWPESI